MGVRGWALTPDTETITRTPHPLSRENEPSAGANCTKSVTPTDGRPHAHHRPPQTHTTCHTHCSLIHPLRPQQSHDLTLHKHARWVPPTEPRPFHHPSWNEGRAPKASAPPRFPLHPKAPQSPASLGCQPGISSPGARPSPTRRPRAAPPLTLPPPRLLAGRTARRASTGAAAPAAAAAAAPRGGGGAVSCPTAAPAIGLRQPRSSDQSLREGVAPPLGRPGRGRARGVGRGGGFDRRRLSESCATGCPPAAEPRRPSGRRGRR